MIIDQHTKIYGVMGYPLGHSLSPTLHNSAFDASGLNAVYLAFETKDLDGCMQGVRGLGLRGMSVTIPYKSAVIPYLDQVDDLAQRIGAVNTIVNDTGRLIGYNTDAVGALRALQDKTRLRGKACILVGAGGAARAIGYVLKEKAVALKVANRSQQRGEALADFLGCPYICLDDLEAETAEILIQTTSVGMSPNINDCVIPEHVLKQGMLVMDIVYNPVETRLLKMARDRGCLTIDGLSMFIQQGAEQFRLWTGMDPPFGTMAQSVRQVLMKGDHT